MNTFSKQTGQKYIQKYGGETVDFALKMQFTFIKIVFVKICA